MTPADARALDSIFRDLQVIISPEKQVVRGTYIGIPQSSPGGFQLMHEGTLATLKARETDPVTTDNTTVWNDIPAIAGDALELYPEGSEIDPVSFTYTGPSGKPYLPEHFDDPGIPLYEKTRDWSSDEGGGLVFFPTGDGKQIMVMHYQPDNDRSIPQEEWDRTVFEILDAETLEPIDSYTFNHSESSETLHYVRRGGIAWDPASNTMYMLMFGHKRPLTIYAVHWDQTTEEFSLSVVDQFIKSPTSPRMLHRGGIFSWDLDNNRLLFSALYGAYPDQKTLVIDRIEMKEYTPTGAGWAKTSHPLSLPGDDLGIPEEEIVFELAGNSNVNIGCSTRMGSHLICARFNMYEEADENQIATPVLDIWQDGDKSWKSRYLPSTVVDPNRVYYGSEVLSWPFSNGVISADGSLLLADKAASPSVYYYDSVEGTPEGEDIFPNNDDAALALMAGSPDTTYGFEFLFSGIQNRMYVLKGRATIATFETARLQSRLSQITPIAPGTLYTSVVQSSEVKSVVKYEIIALTASITENPADQVVNLVHGVTSELVSFTADYASDSETTMKWQERAVGAEYFTDIEGANGKTLTVDADLAKNGAIYRAKLINPTGNVKSNDATLTVRSAPRFLGHPSDMSVSMGDQVTLTAPVDPSIAADSQVWQIHIAEGWTTLTDGDGTTISADTLTITTSEDLQKATFRSVIANEVGKNAFDQAVLTVVVPSKAPVISEHLSSVKVDVGQQATFTAAASGTPAPSVAWEERIAGGSWKTITGADQPTLVIEQAQLAQSGVEYRAVFTNQAGQAISEPAMLTVVDLTPPPQSTDEPTEEPTEEPVVEPTEEPSEEPVVDPTEEPTAGPSEEPVIEPTEEPTGAPTRSQRVILPVSRVSSPRASPQRSQPVRRRGIRVFFRPWILRQARVMGRRWIPPGTCRLRKSPIARAGCPTPVRMPGR